MQWSLVPAELQQAAYLLEYGQDSTASLLMTLKLAFEWALQALTRGQPDPSEVKLMLQITVRLLPSFTDTRSSCH